ncbi:MAG: SGNH/GDSL hydrolase family protein [Methanobacterium sp.]|uniref:SGNH/GDSL hydrolase family protein n=1 Tax=Methanobacterium sp. TaxID=2164 RepID=UPI003C75CD2D
MTKKTVLCYGDSITWGYNPANQNRMSWDERWTGVLTKGLDDNYNVIEEGLKGRTTTWNDPVDGASKNGLNYLIPCLESHKPIDLCILLLGLNDLKKRFSLPSIEIARGITVIIEVIKKSGTGINGSAPKILLLTPPIINPVESLSQEFRNSHNKSRKLPGYYAKIARNYGLEFLDISKIITVSELDGVHINVDEQFKLGNLVLKKVKQIME